MLQTVSKLHVAGILHRDLKPGNLIIDRQRGYVQIVDFGGAEVSPTGEQASTWDWQRSC